MIVRLLNTARRLAVPFLISGFAGLLATQSALAVSAGCNAINGGQLSGAFHVAHNYFQLDAGDQIVFVNRGGVAAEATLSTGPGQAYVRFEPGQSVTLTSPDTATKYVGWTSTNYGAPPIQVDVSCTANVTVDLQVNSPTFGETAVLTANVAATSGAQPSGSVEFFNGGSSLGSAALTGGVAMLSVSGLAAGNYAISATFPGASTGNRTLTVATAPTTLQLSSSTNPSLIGASVQYTASVTNATGGAITGNVEFWRGGALLQTVPLAAGAAQFADSPPLAGSHIIVATYNPDANNRTSNDTLLQQVNLHATTVQLGAISNPVLSGTPAEFQVNVATLTGTTPTGSITLLDGGSAIASGSLTGGSATLHLASLPTGSHNLTISYSGDTTHAPSVSATLAFVVDQAPVGLTLSSSLNPSPFGAAITFTATASSNNGLPPQGNISFSASGGTTFSAALVNGVASWTTSDLAIGSHLIEASYPGSADHLAATSLPLLQTVEALGSIVIKQETVGQDAVFGYSVTPLGIRATVSTLDGSGVSAPIAVAAGTYVITADDMRSLGYAISNITCTGNPAVDLSARSATIEIGPGEQAVCTFSSIGAEATTALIEDAINLRGQMLLNSLPNMSRRIARLDGIAPAARPLGATLLNYLPGLVEQKNQSVSASLAALEQMAGNQAPSALDVWMEATFARVSGNELEGPFAALSLGADYVVTNDLLVGGFLQFDQFSVTSDGGHSFAGQGWLAGPYVTMRLTEHLHLDVLAALGGSSNRVSPLGTYEDGVTTARYLISAELQGQWSHGPWTFQPHTSLRYLQENSDSYIDQLGLAIPAVSVGLGQWAMGPGIAYRTEIGGDVDLTTSLQLDGVLDITGAGISSPHGRIDGNIQFAFPGGASLGFGAGYAGLGSSTQIISGRTTISAPIE